MTKLTNKAIARMSGYRLVEKYCSFPNMQLPWATYYWWIDPETEETGSGRYAYEEQAYDACCIDNKLIED